MKKTRRSGGAYPLSESAAAVLRDARVMPQAGLAIPVREARARFSALLELVAAGREITITSDGNPRALLVPADTRRSRRVFTGTIARLRELPMQTTGPTGEELIRADRDGRGW